MTGYPKISFDLFNTAFRAHVQAHEAADAFYAKLPSQISAAFFDNDGVDAYQKGMNEMFMAVCAKVDPELPKFIHYWMEPPFEMDITLESGEAIHLKGVDEVLDYLKKAYFPEPQPKGNKNEKL